ncbi:MAG TPA: chemotaxis protein CheW [Geobacteraceae bacterium]|nr:chemotaxis protein CheW [Geobacteraceae bacterium]
MTNGETYELPSSGLAEDILAQFIDKAQVEVNQINIAESRDMAMLLHLVTFQLGKEEYGVEIASVQEIIRATDITHVPGAPSHVRGVINLRGKIIPVVDLRRRFALASVESSDNQRIIVVELGEKRIGMLVDSVSQVIKVPAGVVEEMPEEATSVDENFIRGVGKLESRLIIILDLNKSLLLS